MKKKVIGVALGALLFAPSVSAHAQQMGKVFRIGHLGDFNDLMLAGTLSGVEMGLALAGVPHSSGGVAAALDYMTQAAEARRLQHAAVI